MKSGNLIYRSWYYFRNGWSLYFAFIFAAINTLTVTYYLAIERIPSLQVIFPSFFQYVLIVVLTGIPFLTLIGYLHWKKSGARKAEIDISYEVDPYRARILVNSEILLKININLIQLLTKITNDEKISDKEKDEVDKINTEIQQFVEKRNFKNKLDLTYIKTETQEEEN